MLEHCHGRLSRSPTQAWSEIEPQREVVPFQIDRVGEIKFEGEIRFESGPLPAWITPGRGAAVTLSGKPLAVFGELSAEVVQKHKLKQVCVVAEVKAQALLEGTLRQPVSRELSRFQAVDRDFSFIFPDSVRWHDAVGSVRALQIAELLASTC